MVLRYSSLLGPTKFAEKRRRLTTRTCAISNFIGIHIFQGRKSNPWGEGDTLGFYEWDAYLSSFLKALDVAVIRKQGMI
jgi:hypothetical protein